MSFSIAKASESCSGEAMILILFRAALLAKATLLALLMYVCIFFRTDGG